MVNPSSEFFALTARFHEIRAKVQSRRRLMQWQRVQTADLIEQSRERIAKSRAVLAEPIPHPPFVEDDRYAHQAARACQRRAASLESPYRRQGFPSTGG